MRLRSAPFSERCAQSDDHAFELRNLCEKFRDLGAALVVPAPKDVVLFLKRAKQLDKLFHLREEDLRLAVPMMQIYLPTRTRTREHFV